MYLSKVYRPRSVKYCGTVLKFSVHLSNLDFKIILNWLQHYKIIFNKIQESETFSSSKLKHLGTCNIYNGYRPCKSE